ncbi:MAG: DUF1835 domain-containing protein [Parvibaculaceae bacterium]|nr:DUF1835 domain-containing protein [Parvibaculaceae bacterium]
MSDRQRTHPSNSPSSSTSTQARPRVEIDESYDRHFFSGRLNFEQQGKRAKELLQALRRGEEAALDRVHTVFERDKVGQWQLADAQFVTARENGFASWGKMKTHCEMMALRRKQMEAERFPVLDTRDVVHVRCGSDIQHSLTIAGFTGQFVEFADPFCQGPVLDVSAKEHLAVRSAYLSSAYDLVHKDSLARGQREYAQLDATRSAQHVVLWFEHDTYDQFILAYLLDYFSNGKRPETLELICIDQVSGVPDFVGLGQLAPEQLQVLWEEQRRPVTRDMFLLGSSVWSAYRGGDISALEKIAATGTPAVPQMAGALRRQLQELPSVQTGLGLTQFLTLDIIAQNPGFTAGKVYSVLMREREPLPFLGDLMFWHVVQDLNHCEQGLIDGVDLSNEGGAKTPWPERILRLTELGEDVVSGRIDFLSVYDGKRFVGGCVFDKTTTGPRWDDLKQTVEML